MIDFENAMKAFKEYLKNFDVKYGKIDLKIRLPKLSFPYQPALPSGLHTQTQLPFAHCF